MSGCQLLSNQLCNVGDFLRKVCCVSCLQNVGCCSHFFASAKVHDHIYLFPSTNNYEPLPASSASGSIQGMIVATVATTGAKTILIGYSEIVSQPARQSDCQPVIQSSPVKAALEETSSKFCNNTIASQKKKTTPVSTWNNFNKSSYQCCYFVEFLCKFMAYRGLALSLSMLRIKLRLPASVPASIVADWLAS